MRFSHRILALGFCVVLSTFNDSMLAPIDLNQGCKSTANITTQNTLNGTCAAVLAGADATGNLFTPNDCLQCKQTSRVWPFL